MRPLSRRGMLGGLAALFPGLLAARAAPACDGPALRLTDAVPLLPPTVGVLPPSTGPAVPIAPAPFGPPPPPWRLLEDGHWVGSWRVPETHLHRGFNPEALKPNEFLDVVFYPRGQPVTIGEGGVVRTFTRETYAMWLMGYGFDPYAPINHPTLLFSRYPGELEWSAVEFAPSDDPSVFVPTRVSAARLVQRFRDLCKVHPGLETGHVLAFRDPDGEKVPVKGVEAYARLLREEGVLA